MSGINWKAGSWNAEVFEQGCQRILFAGDWAPVRHYREALSSRPGVLYESAILDAFRQADRRIVNVEAVLHSDPGALKPVCKEGPNLAGPPEAVADLKALSADAACLANNHVYDYGLEGLEGTRAALEAAGILTCGTGATRADAYDGCVLKAGPHEVAIVNFQEGEEGGDTGRAPEVAGWDLTRVCEAIGRHRATGRLVIAVPHADREFLPLPAPYIQEAYRELVEAGASAVVAHHPHVPRGIEIHKGAPICYSLGNFAFWQDHPGLFRKLGYLLTVGISPLQKVGLKLLPYRLQEDRIHALQGNDRERFMRLLAGVSGTALYPDAVRAGWNAAIDAIPVKDWYASCTGMDYTFARMRAVDPVGLARMRTRLSSPAHYTFMRDGITRVLDGRHGSSDPRLIRKVLLWTGGTTLADA